MASPWRQTIRGFGVEYEIVDALASSAEDLGGAHRSGPSRREVVRALGSLGSHDARIEAIDVLTERGLLQPFGLDRLDDTELFDMLERSIDDRRILILTRPVRPAAIPAAHARPSTPDQDPAKRMVLDKFIRVLLFDCQGGTVPSKSGPPKARVEVRTQTGATFPAAVTAGKADVAGIPGATPYACQIAIRASAEHACTLSRDGHVFCWGDNSYGEVGADEAHSPAIDPRSRAPKHYARVTRVPDVADAVDVSTGSGFSCALERSGTMLCWGGIQQSARQDAMKPWCTPMPVTGE